MPDAPARPDVHDAASFQAASGCSDAQLADLVRFRALLAEWNEKLNLVGPSALEAFWPRHAWDSAQLLKIEPHAKVWADLGAGAGFPGLVLAILLKGTPGAHIHLVESLTKRCRFLEAVVGTLNLPATVHNARAEALSLKVDAVTARAVAPLVRLLGYAEPYLKRGAVGVFLKGQDVVSELTEATRYWKFDVDLVPSLSSSGGQVVRVKGLIRVRKV
jgi:16S rRNA (guanine527-N7)-methyltransferase